MADLVGDILNDHSGSSGIDSDDCDSHGAIPEYIMDETDTLEYPATPKSTTSTVSTSTRLVCHQQQILQDHQIL